MTACSERSHLIERVAVGTWCRGDRFGFGRTDTCQGFPHRWALEKRSGRSRALAGKWFCCCFEDVLYFPLALED